MGWPKDSGKDFMKQFKEVFYLALGSFFFEGPSYKTNKYKGWVFMIPVIIAMGIVLWLVWDLFF